METIIKLFNEMKELRKKFSYTDYRDVLNTLTIYVDAEFYMSHKYNTVNGFKEFSKDLIEEIKIIDNIVNQTIVDKDYKNMKITSQIFGTLRRLEFKICN